MVTLHAINPEAMSTYSDRLSSLFAEGQAFKEAWRTDGMAWVEIVDGKPTPCAKVPFGYTDGISMTTIRGGPERYTPDHQRPCEDLGFLFCETTLEVLVLEPRELGLNGSFAAFKMIMTDVVGFENFLQSNKDEDTTPNYLPRRCAGGGATVFRWRCRRNG